MERLLTEAANARHENRIVKLFFPLALMNRLSGFIEAWRYWKRTWKEAEGKVLPIKLAPTLKDRSAFKLTNTFWHSSLACMLLQKCLLGSGRGAPKLSTLDQTPGDQRWVYFLCRFISACTCIVWISVWVCVLRGPTPFSHDTAEIR